MASIYQIQQFNIHFEHSSRVNFGFFTSQEQALEEMEEGFEKLYPGFKKDLCENGRNQWTCDKYDFGVMISEITLNEFGEI